MRLIDIEESLHNSGNQLFLSFSMQRSGQHLVIDWICRGLNSSAAHFNHCRLYPTFKGLRLKPMVGRVTLYSKEEIVDSGKIGRNRVGDFLENANYEKEFFSMEDVLPTEINYKYLCKKYQQPIIIILRDPANWLASSLKHPKFNNGQIKAKLKKYERFLELAFNKSEFHQMYFISFNRFILDYSYRSDLAKKLNLGSIALAEEALNRVPDFGGGSSFEGNSSINSIDVCDRWKEYETDEFFRMSMKNDRLNLLSKEFFGQDFIDTF